MKTPIQQAQWKFAFNIPGNIHLCKSIINRLFEDQLIRQHDHILAHNVLDFALKESARRYAEFKRNYHGANYSTKPKNWKF